LIKPIHTSKAEFSNNATDSTKVMELRTWQKDYFTNELIYDHMLHSNLNKVKETINRDTDQQPSYEREFDIIVKVEDIVINDSKTELKVTDNTNLLFEILVDSSILPTDTRISDVIRLCKLQRRKEGANQDRTLIGSDHSNCMMLRNWFKMHNRLSSKMQNEAVDLMDAILGGAKV
jgi:hypothetical protein